MVIPEHLLNAVKKVQDTILICPPVISQYAALGALQAKDNYLKDNIKTIAQTRKIVINALQELEDLCTIKPANGAFYFFLKVHTQMDSLEIVKTLIQEHKIAVIPGTTFGIENGCYLRLAYGALQQQTAKQGIERLVKGIKSIIG